ncbi:hypothetical protein POM88_054710 [Heracleum sosnowskyi]|uniref:FRIGIDA-like protein n=1 Tax=Heracleum sosnowskyi TaxID=360622 RepID=A0AAD8GN20_9APIA|nr:hypothetical protein POM88_054710 [Heracleum sosnowskyi]
MAFEKAATPPPCGLLCMSNLGYQNSLFMFCVTLVLSSLEWKMNPLTPFSFFDHIIRRLELESFPHWEFLRRCDCLFHSIVTDSRILCYLPSVVASAIMCLVIKEVDLNNALEFQNQLMDILKISKERVDECCNLITELLGDCGYKKYLNHKRKYCHVFSSPIGVINGYLSCDSTSDSWTVALVSSWFMRRFRVVGSCVFIELQATERTMKVGAADYFSIFAMQLAARKEQSALRAVVKCIEEYKLEAEFPSESLKKLLEQLEKVKTEKKRPAAVHGGPMPPAKAGRLTNASVSSFPAPPTFVRSPSHSRYPTTGVPQYQVSPPMYGHDSRSPPASHYV